MESSVLDFSVLLGDAEVLFDKKNTRVFLGNVKRLEMQTGDERV